MTPACATPEPDVVTLRLALSGDAPALGRLYARHQRLVLGVCQRLLARAGLCEPASDLAAEVWLRLLEAELRALRGFEPARGSLRTFLAMIAHQHARVVVRRWQRRRQHERTGTQGHEPLTPCATLALHRRHLLGHVIGKAQARLPSRDLVLLEDLLVRQTPVPELAHQLGITPEILYGCHARLRARMRSMALEPGPAARASGPRPVSSTPRGPGTRSRPRASAPRGGDPAGASPAPAR